MFKIAKSQPPWNVWLTIEWSPRDVNSTTICLRTVLVVMKKNNKLTLNPHKRQMTTYCGIVSSLKSDCNLFSRLYVASQFPDVNLNGYFSNENQPCPPSVSARGKLKLGTKSDIVRCLEDASEKQDDITPSVDVVMLDGPAMLCVVKPEAAGTLREYACPGCVPTIMWNRNWVKDTKMTRV